MNLTPKHIQLFIEEKWRNMKCPRCEQVTWQVGEAPDFKGLIALGDDDASAIGAVGQHFLPVIWVLCTNCGHLEWIGTKVIRRWISEKKKGGGGNG